MISDDLAGHDVNFTPHSTMQIWNGNGYDSFFYASPENATEWEAMMPEQGYGDFGGKWITGSFTMDSCAITNGVGFWIDTDSESSIYFSGQVYTPTETTKSLVAGLNLISNPFPLNWNIQDFTSTGLVGHNSNFEPQTMIQIWNGNGYDSFFYASPENAVDWDIMMPEQGYGDFGGKWITGSFTLANDQIIVPGKGFWITTVAPATLQFSR